MNDKQRTNMAKYFYDLSKGFVMLPFLTPFKTTLGFSLIGLPMKYATVMIVVTVVLCLATSILLLTFAYKLDGKK